MRGVFRVFLTLALAASSFGYFIAGKRVTLADDGRVTTIDTFAPTVGDALERSGIRLDEGDRIKPSPGKALELNKRIEVTRARDVVVVLNGSRSVERVAGRTVAEILAELRVSSQGAYISAGRAGRVDTEEIVVSQPVEVTVVHDGMSQPIVTNVLTAGGLLRQMGIALGPYDRVEPSIVASPVAGAEFKVIRVKEAIEKVSSPIAFKKVTEKTDSLDLGVKKVKSPGVAGVRTKSYRVVFEDGKAVSKELVSNDVTRQPRDEVVLLGTRKPVLLSATNSQQGKASWYRISGMAAAHRTLPFGTVVKVTNLANGKTVTVVIRDRGPYIDGRIIDLSESAFAEIASLGSGVVPVKIEW